MKRAGRSDATEACRVWVFGSCVLAAAMFVADPVVGVQEPNLELGAPNSHPHEPLGITLRVYDYADLAQTVLTSSEETATTIFQQAGVLVTWVDCPVSPAGFEKHPACRGKMGTTDFALRILPRSMAGKLPITDGLLGVAQQCPDDERGCVANVSYFRVDELAPQGGARAAKILGHTMAHEVGHLLLGPNSHSLTGLMRGSWSLNDIKLMSRSYLFFTPRQSDRLRADLVRRSDLELHSTASRDPGE